MHVVRPGLIQLEKRFFELKIHAFVKREEAFLKG
jgi:hypothetical protein